MSQPIYTQINQKTQIHPNYTKIYIYIYTQFQINLKTTKQREIIKLGKESSKAQKYELDNLD